jgi:hypothetical protein
VILHIRTTERSSSSSLPAQGVGSLVRISSPSSGETRLLAGFQKIGRAGAAEALTFLVLLESQKNGASSDLQTIMQGVKVINSQKGALRKALNTIQQEGYQTGATEAADFGYSNGIAGSLQVQTPVQLCIRC